MRFWDITVYEGGEKHETIRGLTQAQKNDLMEVFARNDIPAEAIEYDETRNQTGSRQTVNI